MKYKAYLTDSDKIFWTKNSVDKPTKDYFLQLMDSITWKEIGDITPNFENQFNGSLVVDSDKYTYLKLINNTTNEIKYYSIDRVSKELNNGYVIDITLDVFTTYTLYFYDSIKDKPIKVNRSSMFRLLANSIFSQMTPDNLIPDIQTYDVINSAYPRIKLSPLSRDIKGYTGQRYNMTNNSTWTLDENISENMEFVDLFKRSSGYIYGLTLFDIYQDVSGDYYCVPIFGEVNPLVSYQQNWLTINIERHNVANYFCYNFIPFTDNVKNNTFWVNKYQGRYIIPNWMYFVENLCTTILIRTTNDGYNNYILMYRFGGSINHAYPAGTLITTYDYSSQGLNTFNKKSNKLNNYSFLKILKQNNTPVLSGYNELKLISPRVYGINDSQSYLYMDILPSTANNTCVFNQSQGFIWFANNLPYSWSLSGGETLPTSTNTYQSYLASVQSSQNTNIQIAKQQMVMGITQNIWSGAMGLMRAGTNIAGGIISANPTAIAGGVIGAADSLFNTGFGIAKNIQQFQNAKRQQDAANADKLRSSTANTINPTSIDSIIKNSAIQLKNYGNDIQIPLNEIDGFIAPKLTDSSLIIQINSALWDSGYLINRNLVLESEVVSDIFTDGVNLFTYWDMEIPFDYIKINYPNYNNELIEAISTTINNPVRFWKQQPDYNCNLIIGLT